MKMKLWIELILLFVGVPTVLALDVSPIIKVIPLVLGVSYLSYHVIKAKLFTKEHLIGTIHFPAVMWWRITIFLVLSTIVAFYFIPDEIFQIVIKKPFLWLGVVIVYSCTSVYAQEFVYRTFFFHRYKDLISPTALLWINAIVFGIAHAMFRNYYVVFLTFLGGLVFALTFVKTKSLLVTSIEHAIYGAWLFTLGIGQDLAFPEA
ncbi:MAG: CPBP family intramembrane metalloprotease [Cytophagales bacterium]|nr:CPBP family intramembrane metalloprotease [Cytophagales bacterium]